MQDVIGYAPGYGGYDIMGQAGQLQLGQPPMGASMAGPAMVPAGYGWARNLDSNCGVGDPREAVLVQQNQQEWLGLQPRCPSFLETQFVGFEACNIDPCETVTIRCQPCISMKIIQLVIPSSIASQIQINSITVNGKWNLVNCGPLPGEMFLPDAVRPVMLATQTVQPGCCIEFSVTNISQAALYFNMGGYARVWF